MPQLICVGCGPGDPELLTVKAVKAIQDAQVIMCPTSKEGKPSIALAVVSQINWGMKNFAFLLYIRKSDDIAFKFSF